MKNFLAAFWVALMCLVGAVAHATAPTGVPLFVELARDNPQELQAAMTAAGAFKPDRGEVYVPIVGMAMHQTLKAAGVLREEMVNIPPGRNPTIEAAVREHGQILSWPVFLERAQAGRFIAPRQVLREEVWQAYSAKLAQTAPVQAASAPTTQPAAAAPAPQPATPVAVAPAPPAVDAAAMQALEAEVAAARRDAATARDVATAQGQAHATINSRVRAAEARAAALAKQLAEMQVAARAQTAAQERALAKLLEEQGAALKAATDLSRKTQEAVAASVPALATAAANAAVGERTAVLKLALGGVGIAALIAILMGVANGRKTKRALSVANDAKTVVASARQDINGLVDEVAAVDDRVTAVAEKVGLEVKDVRITRDVLLHDLTHLGAGSRVTHGVTVVLIDGREIGYEVTFTHVDGKYVKIQGVRNQTQPLKIENVLARIKRAGFKGELLKTVRVTDHEERTLTLREAA